MAVAKGKLGKRPPPEHVPVRPAAGELARLAERARYVGSVKHKFGKSSLGVGRPGKNPVRPENLAADDLPKPYCTICPDKWNRRPPEEQATGLLREAIRQGRIEPVITGQMPKFAYIRDPEENDIIYRAHLMSEANGTYKAYPLTQAEIDDLETPPP